MSTSLMKLPGLRRRKEPKCPTQSSPSQKQPFLKSRQRGLGGVKEGEGRKVFASFYLKSQKRRQGLPGVPRGDGDS